MPNPKTILVTGVNGQLGQSLKCISAHYPDYLFSFISRDELNLSQDDSITAYFQQNKFDIIINCAVDKAEQEPEWADTINYIAVKKLAETVRNHGLILIHISTDDVFDGTNYRPYVETDPNNPQSIYGASKFKCEQVMQAIAPNGCMIRTSWVYSEYGNNFVKTTLKSGQKLDKLTVIFDQVGSPTYDLDLAPSIMHMVNNTDYFDNKHDCPIYHYSNEGVCSWYDFAKSVFELSNINCVVSPIETKGYPTPRHCLIIVY